MDVVDIEQQPGHALLAVARQAELGGGLDGVDGVAARVGQPHHLRLAGLRLEQVGGEVAGAERMARGAEHLPAGLGDHRGGRLLERVAEGVVGGQEEPCLAAALDHCLGRGVGQRVGVVGVVHRDWRAQVIGNALAAGAGEHHDLVLLLRHVQHGQRRCRSRHIQDGIDLVRVEPFARLVGGDVGLVLVIHHHQLNFLAEHLAAEVVNGHLRRRGAAAPGHIGVEAAHVEQQADLDHVIGNPCLWLGRGDAGHTAGTGQRQQRSGSPPPCCGSLHGCLLQCCYLVLLRFAVRPWLIPWPPASPASPPRPAAAAAAP
ncbi:hypothetical protein D3C81_1313730 [compost metagenome]